MLQLRLFLALVFACSGAGVQTLSAQKTATAAEESVMLPTVCVAVDPPSMGTSGTRADRALHGWRGVRHSLAEGRLPIPAAIESREYFLPYELPLPPLSSRDLVEVVGHATAGRVAGVPEVEAIAQFGLRVNEELARKRRLPLNLVVAVDGSTSADDQRRALARECLRHILASLGPADQLSIVATARRGEIVLEPTWCAPAHHAEILSAIDVLNEGGQGRPPQPATGKAVETARSSREGFHGHTRILYLVNTAPGLSRSVDGFLTLNEQAAREGIGVSVVGVGVHFQREFVDEITRLPGGRVFGHWDAEEIRRVFRHQLAKLTSEVGRDFELVVRPRRGWRLAGVYGVPANSVEWHGRRDLRLAIPTLFFEERSPSYFVSLARESGPALPPAMPGDPIVEVLLAYESSLESCPPLTSEAEVRWVSPDDAGPGLRRGSALVGHYTALKRAADAQFRGRGDEARQWLASLKEQLAKEQDPVFAEDCVRVEACFASLAPTAGESTSPRAAASEAPQELYFSAWQSVQDPHRRICILPGGRVVMLRRGADGEQVRLGEDYYLLSDGLFGAQDGSLFAVRRENGRRVILDGEDVVLRSASWPREITKPVPTDPFTGLPERRKGWQAFRR